MGGAMKRRNARVIAISAGLAVTVAAAVAYSVLVVDRRPSSPVASGSSPSSLLALTWGPSLCTAEPANSGCKSGHVARLGSSFVLHGLWPQPSSEQYCDIPKRTADRRSIALPPDVEKTLKSMMSDSRFMASHEWFAHGTCSGLNPSEYFGVATTLAAQAIKVLNPVFGRAGGKPLPTRVVRETFDAQFGRGSGNRVTLTCRDVDGRGTLVYEVRLSLPAVADLRGEESLGDALGRGPAVPAGCGKGLVP